MKPPFRYIIIIVFACVAVLVIAEVAALLLKRSVAVYADYWQKNNTQTVGAHQVLYIALGDSTAQGVGASTPTKGYVGLLAGTLSKKHAQPVKIYNLSVSGATTEDVIRNQLPLLKQTAITSKTIITLSIGANDMKNFDAGVFTSRMETLLGALPKQTVVADIAYFGGGPYRKLEGTVQTANSIINQLSAKYGLGVAPLHTVTKQKHTVLVNAADVFHPSNVGYRNWHDAFAIALNL